MSRTAESQAAPQSIASSAVLSSQRKRPAQPDSPYMHQLDGIRGLAVLCILWHHWTPEAWRVGIPWQRAVQCFYVLSGFLITGILLRARDTARRNRQERFVVFSHFYIRRGLRIFPLYYAVLFSAVLAGINGLPRHLGWHLLYCSNICYLLYEGWGTPIGHFWTLAVEEQFYLFWPIIVLFSSQRTLVVSLFFLTLSAVVYRFTAEFLRPGLPHHIFTLASFDSLAIGGLLAAMHNSLGLKSRMGVLSSLVVAASICFVMLSLAGLIPDRLDPLGLFCYSVLFAAVINKAATGYCGVIGAFLTWSWLTYLGGISYGIYIFHNFASIPAKALLRVMPVLEMLPANLLVINFVLTLGLASFSWIFFERPILRLKRFFPMPAAVSPAGNMSAIRQQ